MVKQGTAEDMCLQYSTAWNIQYFWKWEIGERHIGHGYISLGVSFLSKHFLPSTKVLLMTPCLASSQKATRWWAVISVMSMGWLLCAVSSPWGKLQASVAVLGLLQLKSPHFVMWKFSWCTFWLDCISQRYYSHLINTQLWVALDKYTTLEDC